MKVMRRRDSMHSLIITAAKRQTCMVPYEYAEFGYLVAIVGALLFNTRRNNDGPG